MKSASLLFLIGFAAMSASWGAFVLAPQIQVGRAAQTAMLGGSTLYPQARPGLAAQGAQVYRANGCNQCHSREARQTGVAIDLMLTDAGTNAAATLDALRQLDIKGGTPLIASLPKDIMRDAPKREAERALKVLEDAGAKAAIRIRPVGPDLDRGWGLRGSIGLDYLFDDPVLLGSQRLGPDLGNIGLRQPDPGWHLKHLYAPSSVVPESTMPPYRFLFQEQRIRGGRSADAVVLDGEHAPREGFEIVPTDEAKALAAYLVSLRASVPLFEAPFTGAAPPAPAATGSNPAVTNTASAQ